MKQSLKTVSMCQKIMIVAAACFVSIAISLDLKYIEPREGLTGLYKIFMQLLDALPARTENIALMLLACGIGFLFFYFVISIKRRKANQKNNIYVSAIVLALFFAFVMLFGFAYSEANTATFLFDGGTQIVKTCLCFIAWLSIGYVVIFLLFTKLDRMLVSFDSGNRICKYPTAILWLIDTHPLLGTAIFIGAAWLPSLIGFAPALFMGDTPTQILMWFNLPNYHSDLLNLIDPNVQLCQHHPVLHTAFLGLCVEVGLLVGNATIGISLYVIIQYLFTILVISYAMMYLKKRGVKRCVRVFVLVFFAFVPVFSNYSVLITKDTPFAAALLLFIVQIAKTINHENCKVDWIILVVSGILVGLLRNGGIVYSSIGIIVCLLAVKQERRAIVVSAISVVLICFAFSNVLMPALSITPGSQREILSIPFQQTARYVTIHHGDIPWDQQESIDKVLGYDSLVNRYNPKRSDPIKDGFNKNVTPDQMSAYWETWIEQGLNDPLCYFEATANNYFEYFYLTDDYSHYSKEWSAQCMKTLEGDLAVHQLGNPLSDVLGKVMTFYQALFIEMPFLSLTTSSCFYVWILLLLVAYCAHARRWRSLAVLCPLILVFLTCLIGPCNGSYFRYIFPVAFSLPIAVSLCLFVKKDCMHDAMKPDSGAQPC